MTLQFGTPSSVVPSSGVKRGGGSFCVRRAK